MRVLIGGHKALRNSPELIHIVGELNRVAASARIPKHNGWLLGLFHSTRALDTTLRVVVLYKGWPASPGLGAYLRALRTNNVIGQKEFERWTRTIVKRRNRYMHRAGAMPTQFETDELLSEMHACVAIVLAKT